MAGRFGSFYKDDPGTEYVYGPTDTGKGGGSINTGSKGQPSSNQKEKPRDNGQSRRDKKHDKEIYDQMKADDKFMSEPNETRGTESGAYDGLDTEALGNRQTENV